MTAQPINGNRKLPVEPLWRVFFRHSSPGIDGLSQNTYRLPDALAMLAHWAPRVAAKASLVPAGALLSESPACGVGNHDHCARLGAAACSCTCHPQPWRRAT